MHPGPTYDAQPTLGPNATLPTTWGPTSTPTPHMGAWLKQRGLRRSAILNSKS